MVDGIKDKGNFNDFQEKFQKYAEGIQTSNLEGHKVTVAKKDGTEKSVDAKVAISKLMNSYRKLGQYQNLSKSSAASKMDQILNSPEFKNEYPVKRLMLKLNKFGADLSSSFRAFRGKLKTPEASSSPQPSAEEPSPGVAANPTSKPTPLLSKQEEILNKFRNFGEKTVQFSGNNLDVYARKSKTSDGISLFFKKDFKDGSVRDGILRIYLDKEKDQVSIKQFFPITQAEAEIVSMPFSELNQEKILQVIEKHIGQESNVFKSNAELILDKLGKPGPDEITLGPGRTALIQNFGPSSVIISTVDRSGQSAEFTISIKNDQALIRQVFTDHGAYEVGVMPLSALNKESVFEILNKVIDKQEDLRSPVEQMLDKLGNPTAKQRIAFGNNGFCQIRKSSAADAVTLVANGDAGDYAAFRLYMDKKQVYVKQMIGGAETTIGAIPLKDLTQKKLIDLTLKHSGFKEPESGLASHTVLARMLGSVIWSKDDIKLEAIKRGFDPDKCVGEYSAEKIKNFLNHYDAAKNINPSSDMTIAQLISKIEESKQEGLVTKESYAATSYILESYLKVVPPQDREFFETFQQRFEEQFKYEWDERPHLKKLLLPPANIAGAEQFAKKGARDLLRKADKPEYQQVGALISGGWNSRTKGGHHINIEVRKAGDKYHIILNNAGSGARFHRKVYDLGEDGYPIPRKDNAGITTKIFEADASEAEEILKNVLLFKSQPQEGDNNSGDFYELFNKAKVIEDYSIPIRPFQDIGNCSVRNVQESLFYIAQRQGKIDAVNAFQDHLTSELLLAAKHYPALERDLVLKGKKPRIKPLQQGVAQLVLREITANKDHVLPQGLKGQAVFPIGTQGVVSVEALNVHNLSRLQAQLVQKDGKYYLERHPKCYKDNVVGLVRGAQMYELTAGNQMEVQKGDIIQLNGYKLVVA